MKCQPTNRYTAVKTAGPRTLLVYFFSSLCAISVHYFSRADFEKHQVNWMWPTVPDNTNAKTKAQFNWPKCSPSSEAPFLNLKASPHASFMSAVAHAYGGHFRGQESRKSTTLHRTKGTSAVLLWFWSFTKEPGMPRRRVGTEGGAWHASSLVPQGLLISLCSLPR